MEKLTNKNCALAHPCHHGFHAGCIKEWITEQATSALDQTCPMCRRRVQLVLPPAPPDPHQVPPQPGLPPAPPPLPQSNPQPAPAVRQAARIEDGNGDIVVLELEPRKPENRRIESTLLTGIKRFSRTIACIITYLILSIFELVKKQINRIRCSFNLCVFSTAFITLVVLVLFCDPKEETGPDGTTTAQCKGVNID